MPDTLPQSSSWILITHHSTIPPSEQNDIIAGLSVAFMAVPQSLSYANSAGLPAVFGLYGCFTPCLAYALLGTSRQLAVGPVAVTSLLIASKLKQIVPGAASITNPNQPDPDQVRRRLSEMTEIVASLYV